jgi:hypothetical protein
MYLVPNSAYQDGLWHSHELHLRWNTPGQSDGLVEYWLDGGGGEKAPTKRFANVDFGYEADDTLTRIGVGLGNTDEENPFIQAEWSAIAFDDIVLSKGYVGPLPVPDGCGDGICSETCTTCPADCISKGAADNNPCDGTISNAEIAAHMQLWRQGTSIPLSQLMETIRLWKQG